MSAGAKASEEGPDSATGRMPGNPRPRQREGKCRREQTTLGRPGERVKGCGKSAPLLRRRRGHGKPHAEQGRIGGPRVPVPAIHFGGGGSRVGCSSRAVTRGPDEWTSPFGVQNPAYSLLQSFSLDRSPGPIERKGSEMWHMSPRLSRRPCVVLTGLSRL
jgi:hypothetical protein